jgi:agmatinase
MSIDINSKASYKDGIFGLPFKEKDAKVVYLPVPWDVTTSYLAGTNKGPQVILKASEQIDFFDLEYGDAYNQGLFLRKNPASITRLNQTTRKIAEKIIDASDEQMKKSKPLQSSLKKVNQASEQLNKHVYEEAKKLLQQNKIPVVLGGDHSTPYGSIKAFAEKYPGMGILHFDAHSDTRMAYMGFNHSHASIMYNVMENIDSVSKLVQVGIRDFCQQEYEYTRDHKKIKVYYDLENKYRQLAGTSFKTIAQEIIGQLPDQVYISFDIDGLDPKYCPHTGTPVAGGLEYLEVCLILNLLAKSGKTIVGFDLVEVAPGKNDEWDANVGMRLLYKMTAAMLASQKLIALK